MAVKATTIFVFFDIALFSLFTAKTLATFADPYSISPCRNLVPDNNNNFSKCYTEYKATYGLAATTEFGKAVDATSRAKKLVATAKDKSSIVLDFLKKNEYNRDQFQEVVSCSVMWITATGTLNSTLSHDMQGKIALSEMELFKAQGAVDFADRYQNQVDCIVGYSPKGVILYNLEALIREAKMACQNALNALKEIVGYKPAHTP